MASTATSSATSFSIVIAASAVASMGEPPLAYPPGRRGGSAARAAERRARARLDRCSRRSRHPAHEPREGQVHAGARACRRCGGSSKSPQSFAELRPVQFTAVRYPGIDAVGHYYLRYALPRAFGDVSDEERLRHGRVLEQYYTYLDGIVGRAMDVARSRGSAARRLGIRHGAAQPRQARARARHGRSAS